MTVKILQLVNSAFFGLQRHISSPADAAVVLGLDTIKALALSVHVFSVFEQGHFTAFSLDDLREHCIETGLLAKRIARSVVSDRKLADDALIGGMLHDAGKLVMAAKIPGEYANIVQTARHDNTSLAQAEMDALKATHGAVGGYLFGLWGFCAEVIEAVAYHHGPAQGSTKEFSALTAVHIADCIISRSRSCEDDVVLPRIDELFLDTIGMRDKLAEWELLCPQEAHAL